MGIIVSVASDVIHMAHLFVAETLDTAKQVMRLQLAVSNIISI
jgi:hypothetical protein